jgi:mono/diheme cytochrome c family protein
MKFIVLLLAAFGLSLPATAAPPNYVLPEETAQLDPGPGLEVVQANCLTCHSAEQITTQPRGMANPQAFWSAEIQRTRTIFGGQIDDAAVPAILAYLVATYGR